jgi:hypothetical protein
MTQLSRPVQILLVATLAFAVVWWLALRPKPVDEPTGAATQVAPGQTGPTGGAAGTGNANTAPGRAVDQAVQGADTASDDAARAAGTDPSATAPAPTPSSPSTATPSAPPANGGANPPSTATTKGLPAPVAKALNQQKVILLLFYNPTAADDRAVRSELKQVKRRGGKVYVAAAPISQLARYQGITRGVQVVQAPTLVVVDPDRKASTITGYTDAVEIDQAVADAIAQSKKPKS